ncbi:hypothetical protein OIDMADRAFT_100000 [Oidiodendron maius Zn]|uniref:N-acetyltransferase domain-containing protein n=1 Tax=Oidiodendron maius (strain Zn) TaxID=913774 RepID=A0A0C3E1D8_OIDMZ|nr:hypothetical protein OIDMADRAFT_100000 [Oidiodendron maius Zn]
MEADPPQATQIPNSGPSWELDGPLVTSMPAVAPRGESPLVGRHVTLIPLQESHTEELYRNMGGILNAHLYKYVPAHPFRDSQSFATFTKSLCDRNVNISYAVSLKVFPANAVPGSSDVSTGFLTGIICLMNVLPSNRSVEIGVLFGPHLQRTTAATEACYLLMKLCLQDLHFLRVEWKTSNLNEASKKSALRLGFIHEGVFRKHMVVEGRRRDTAWFSIIDEDWEGSAREALERWLRNDNFDDQWRQRARLEEIRQRVIKERS